MLAALVALGPKDSMAKTETRSLAVSQGSRPDASPSSSVAPVTVKEGRSSRESIGSPRSNHLSRNKLRSAKNSLERSQKTVAAETVLLAKINSSDWRVRSSELQFLPLDQRKQQEEFPTWIFSGHNFVVHTTSILPQRRAVEIVRGVSWSLLTTVPKRKLRGSLDMNFLWTAEKGVWKGWKRSDRKEKKRR